MGYCITLLQNRSLFFCLFDNFYDFNIDSVDLFLETRTNVNFDSAVDYSGYGFVVYLFVWIFVISNWILRFIGK